MAVSSSPLTSLMALHESPRRLQFPFLHLGPTQELHGSLVAVALEFVEDQLLDLSPQPMSSESPRVKTQESRFFTCSPSNSGVCPVMRTTRLG